MTQFVEPTMAHIAYRLMFTATIVRGGSTCFHTGKISCQNRKRCLSEQVKNRLAYPHHDQCPIEITTKLSDVMMMMMARRFRWSRDRKSHDSVGFDSIDRAQGRWDRWQQWIVVVSNICSVGVRVFRQNASNAVESTTTCFRYC